MKFLFLKGRFFFAPDDGGATGGTNGGTENGTTDNTATATPKTYTEEEYNTLLAEMNRYKQANSKANSSLATATKELRDLKNANLTDAERLKALEEEKNQAISDLKTRLNTSVAEASFAKVGMKAEEYKDILPLIVSDDEEKTAQIADTIAKIYSTLVADYTAKITEATKNGATAAKAQLIKNTTVNPNGGKQNNLDTASQWAVDAYKARHGIEDQPTENGEQKQRKGGIASFLYNKN